MSASARAPNDTAAPAVATRAEDAARSDAPGAGRGGAARPSPVADARAEAANEPAGGGGEAERNNLIKRTVDEICALMGDVHEMREELLARGITFHLLNAMIELGMKDNPEEQEKMLETALEASRKAHGPQAIDRARLREHLDALVRREKDLRHARHLASRQGVHMQALNHLTQLMRQNPGDGGVQAINTFVAYADAAGVPLDRLREILARYPEEPKSVLPDIPREAADASGQSLRELATNLALGAALTVLVMWFVL